MGQPHLATGSPNAINVASTSARGAPPKTVRVAPQKSLPDEQEPYNGPVALRKVIITDCRSCCQEIRYAVKVEDSKMGVIRKKTISRGTEGGLKYICDNCSADITSTVRIHCADDACKDYDLCVPCFSEGSATRDHNPQTHAFSVIEQHSIPIYTKDWGADEELLLLEGAETYGLGSWADIADHIGGYRTKDEAKEHYIKTYVDSSKFPLPERANPKDLQLLEENPREKFQARKKRRIEERKEAAKAAPPATPKQKPTASVPSCHEVQGYMPGRLEFETEFANEAEEQVQNMQFDPGDGRNPRTGDDEPEMELKLVVMDIYNSKLTARADRKKIIFEHTLLDYRKNAAIDKKRTKEERELHNKTKPFARMMNHRDYDDFAKSLEYEHNLRQAITQLQDWRHMRIGDLKTGEKYEAEKQTRAARPAPTGAFDRFSGVRPVKPTPPVEIPSATTALTAPELPERLKPAPPTAPTTNGITKGPLTNGTSNTSQPPPLTNGVYPEKKTRYTVSSIPGTQPLRLTNENATDLHLLSKEEVELCSTLRLMPKAYLAIKQGIISESIKAGGGLKRKGVREICKIDPTKSTRIFDFFVHSGWIQKA